MQVVFDELTASIVGAVVFLLLFSLQLRVQGGRIEDSLVNSAKKQTLNFAEVIERDIANMGYLVAPGNDAIVTYSTTTFGSVTVTANVDFWAVGGSGNRAQIRYQTTPADSALINDVWVPTFTVERFENDGAGWETTGASSSTVTAFNIDLLDLNSIAATRTSARKIRVRLKNAVSPNPINAATGRQSVLTGREMQWGITLTPRGLSLQQYQG